MDLFRALERPTSIRAGARARGVMTARFLPLLALVTASVLALGGGVASAAPGSCRDVVVPVSAPAPGASLHGRLCQPAGRPARTVQLLVSGATYNNGYWDTPAEDGRLSYVTRAVSAGYATFAVDRLGTGASSRPDSSAVSLANGAADLHDVIAKLRDGSLAGQRFARVVWVGHSLGSIYAWAEASSWQDVDGFVLTGLLHASKPSGAAQLAGSLVPAATDPRFAGLDPGYVTTAPGTRAADFYYAPTASPEAIAIDEATKDTMSLTELSDAASQQAADPALAPSHALRAPTLLVLGDHDGLFCGPPDGADCTRDSVLAAERPYYAPAAHLQALIVPATGHDVQLHETAPVADAGTLAWLVGAGLAP
ncbi:hypothetical protein DSM104299_04027 [Baekduia alba]|uniref:alpha/beta hydrolase n=1 Tax=Baekduia alba TaxID=2997333 RepID=UPI0023410A9B|nr:alpha/beta fold hydrolase [Baekduia alba]WCB95284.1 hypothetical protein DSM104299_04027 [Baekduia alba]